MTMKTLADRGGNWTPTTLGGWIRVPVLSETRVLLQEQIVAAATSSPNDPMILLDLGIGRGTLYHESNVIHQLVREGRLKIRGIDLRMPILIECRRALGAVITPTLQEALESDAPVALAPANIGEIDLPEGGLNKIIASFSIHHVFPDPAELAQVLRRVRQGLTSGGIFSLCDVDLDVGPHVWKKYQRLKATYKNVWLLEDAGSFTTEAHDGSRKAHRILDPDESTDATVLREMEERSIKPFFREIEKHCPGDEDARQAAEGNAYEMRRGTEYYHTAAQWQNFMIEAGFGRESIQLMTPEQIKQVKPKVEDVPFIMNAIKA